MSILNLGLQCIGLRRKECTPSAEAGLKNCNSLKQIRSAVASEPSLAGEIVESIEPVKLLISELLLRLALKDRKLKIGTPATETDMRKLNTEIQSIEAIDLFDKVRKGMLKDLPQLKKFLDHCCRFRHYQFSIKKCGAEDCDICRPPRLPQQTFEIVNVLPDPVPGEDEHYLPFEKVYGTNTTEVHRPSSSKRSKKQKTLPFVASIQHVKNVNLMVQCEECGLWRIVYSKKKLSVQLKKNSRES